MLRKASDACGWALTLSLSLMCLSQFALAEDAVPKDAGSKDKESLFRSQWIHVPSVDDSRDFYLDRSSVRVVEGDVEAWDVVVYKQAKQIDSASGQFIKQKRTYRRSSCTRNDQALLKGSTFDSDGKLIELVVQPFERAPKVLIPYGSIAWSQLVMICEIAGLASPQLPGNGLRTPASGSD
jgi:hypothetical protein